MGEVGQTYELELHRPKEDKIPFVCHLTFTAGGGEFGDFVQVTFDSFTLGRFVSFTADGCPDGALQISEWSRPQVGGSWCGTSWGPAIYYSETKSVTLYVNLLRLSKDQNGYNFDYHMEYKFLKQKLAIVRYGGGIPLVTSSPAPSVELEPEYFLGELISGTYCSRIFSDCDRKHCRLQSPNFPGIYPRNLTCYYAVRQHEVPAGKQVLITVRQSKGQLISIRSHATLHGTASTRELKLWDACDDVQDYVTVYDGYTTRDPVILKFCGGGEAVPEATSSGHELLVEFSTSPFGTFLHPAPMQSLHGFQLEVQVKFVDEWSPVFVKNKKQCEFWIRGTNRGILESPQHSLSANTTCLYHLQGIDTNVSPSPVPFQSLSSGFPDWRHAGVIVPPPRYRVWLSILKFHVAGPRDVSNFDQEICRSYLNVWDGQLWAPTNCRDFYCSASRNKPWYSWSNISGGASKRNVSLLARYCKEHVPRSCDHSLLVNKTRFPRPCTLAESFLSSGDSLTLELKLADSTALRPVKFRALYEFVDLHMDGKPYGGGSCSRKFAMSFLDTPQTFRSPRDIFLYGRGGAKNIRVKTAIANKVGIYQQVDGGSWLSIKADKARNNVTSTIAKPPYFPLKWAKFPTTGAIPKTFCYGHIYNYLVTSCELSSSNRDSSDSSDKENEEGNEDFLTSKPFRRGRQYVKSGYVSQLQDGVSKGYYAMKGIVQASYKAQAYNVMVMVSRRRDVVDANCYCRASTMGRCRHVAALLFTLEEYLLQTGTAPTSQTCSWNQGRKRKAPGLIFKTYNGTVNVEKQLTFNPCKKTFTATEDLALVRKFGEEMQCNAISGWELLLRPPYEDYILTCDRIKVLEQLVITLYSLLIGKATTPTCIVADQGTEEWLQCRKVLITASTIKEYHMNKTNEQVYNLVQRHLYDNTTIKCRNFEYGRENEPKARNEYRRQNPTFIVKETGLWVNPDYLGIGASPDALVWDPNETRPGLLGIKCPIILKDTSPCDFSKLTKEQAARFCCNNVDGVLTLKRSHKYFCQIQTQLCVTGKTWCDFFIWTPKGTHTERLYVDVNWFAEIYNKAWVFYSKILIPEYFEMRIPRKLTPFILP